MVVRFSESTKSGSPTKRRRKVQSHEFFSLDSPHPHGILPAGNRFLLHGEDPKDVVAGRSDDTFLLIRDETWMLILGFCDGKTLGNLVKTSRSFYVLASQPELWRDLVLRSLHSSQDNNLLEAVADSWKDTFVLRTCNQQVRSVPMKIPGMYSDYLYRLHSCRSFAIPSAWSEEEPITSTYDDSFREGLVPRLAAENLTNQDFRKYENQNLPVVLSGAAKSWKAFQDWQDPAYLRNQTKGRKFRATSGTAPLPANFTLNAFQQYCSNPTLEEAPLYLFDREALRPNSPLHQDFFPDMERTCPYFAGIQNDLFEVLGEGKRPDHTWAIIGGSHSGSVFHIDPNATHAWNAAIVGKKRWIFYPPGITPPGVHPSSNGDEVALPLSIGEWILTFWGEHQARKKTAKQWDRPLECTAFPGDIVFVPHGWWHMVVNMSPLNIAVTHNFVSRSNLSNLLRFLKLKEDQISGCRDRAESIKPENLHSCMVKALQDRFGNEAEWLVKAQIQAQERWTCRAWRDEEGVETVRDGKAEKCGLEDVQGVTKIAQGGKGRAGSENSVMVKAKGCTSGSGNDSFTKHFFAFDVSVPTHEEEVKPTRGRPSPPPSPSP